MKKFASKIPVFGSVIKIGPEGIIVDIGKNIGLFRRTNLMVYTTEEIESADYRGGVEKVSITKEVAVLWVTEIHDSFSYTEVFSGDGKDIKKGMKVKVITPRFKFSAMLPSIFIPGLGQMIYGNGWGGFGFFLGTGTFMGIGAAMLTADLFAPSLDNRLDTVIERGDASFGPTGRQETGRVEKELLSVHRITAYVLIGVGAFIYIWNIFDAAYPAQKNVVFDGKIASLRRGQIIPVLYAGRNLRGVYASSGLSGSHIDPSVREDIGWYAGVKIIF